MWNKYDTYNIFDLPVPYKALKIYPVRMINYIDFHYYSTVLLLDKNSIPDIKIISMTYLDYLYYETERNLEEKPYMVWLDRLLALVLKDEDFSDFMKSMERYGRDKNGHITFKVGDVIYDSNDFDEIKKIICDQNMLDLPDESIQKELRDKMEEAQRLRQRINNNKICSLEDQIVAVGIYTGWDFDKLYDMTIRKFSKALQRADHKMHYEIYLSASMSGMVEFKDKSFIQHWLADLNKDKYGGNLIESDTIKNKLDFSDKMKRK